ncbi:hypothetical protein BHK98_01965 [Hornefia porci]|uniref:ABC-2 family transporter protein n=2 Tax=Hornefia porci TaxID=2652292 RepID=A0A1Q9JFI2_9FIRM|nr:hypothetical protein BHK98_01965 [Hornefia porci]
MILSIVMYEILDLIRKRSVWILLAVYTLTSFLLLSLENIQNYFPYVESNMILLLNIILPAFLTLICFAALPSAYVQDREQHIDELSATCLVGKKLRNTAKMAGIVLFSLLVTQLLLITTVLLYTVIGHPNWSTEIVHVGWDLTLFPVWPVSRHLVLSAVCFSYGAAILSAVIGLISYKASSTVSSLGITSMFLLFEFLFHKFSFPAVLKEINVFVFLQPYYLFVMTLLHWSPFINLLVLTMVFSPLYILLFWQIRRR